MSRRRIAVTETAAPLAKKLKLDVTVGPADEPKTLVRQILREHQGGRVLVVGHSNTLSADGVRPKWCEIRPADFRRRIRNDVYRERAADRSRQCGPTHLLTRRSGLADQDRLFEEFDVLADRKIR